MLAALLVGFVGPLGPGSTQAVAATQYFTGTQNNEWTNDNNWESACSGGSPGAEPGASDDVVICASAVAHVTTTTAVARTVTVQSGARIDIRPGSGDASLTLGSASDPLTSTLTGTGRIELLTPTTSGIAILAFTSASNHTLDGGGSVRGRDNNAEIRIATSKTLTNSAMIEGKLKITHTTSWEGTFANEADVGASESGTLLVQPYILNDTSAAAWGVIANNSVLRFGSGINTIADGSLEGDFEIGNFANAEIDNDFPDLESSGRLFMSNGILTVSENLTLGSNNNNMSADGGRIDVAAGKTFIHN